MPVDTENLSSAERIRAYLTKELGSELLDQIHPILKSFGDDILLTDKFQDLQKKLSPLVSSEQVAKYYQYFATLVFFELGEETTGEDQARPYDAAGMMNVINCFKDASATATFGKFGLGQTMGKKFH